MIQLKLYLKLHKTAQPANRIEDLLGQRHVPADAYYGIHTLRAIENFNISVQRSLTFLSFRGMVATKKAAALANKELAVIPKDVANYIIQACDLILETDKVAWINSDRCIPRRRWHFSEHEYQRSDCQRG